MYAMTQLLNAIAVIATFVACVGFIYIVLNSTIGRITILKNAVIADRIMVKDIVFIAIGAFLVLRFCTFYLPY